MGRHKFLTKLGRGLRPRALARTLRRRKTKRLILITSTAAALALIGLVTYSNMQTHIPPQAYVPLLNTIAEGESKGNYNAYFGNAGNASTKFTDMTLSQVIAWQKQYVAQGSVSSAVGRYQIIRPTLEGLVQQLKLNTNAKFTPQLQDELARTLINRRGAVEFVDAKITGAQFAENLSREWASLPKATGPNPQQSYYAGDGVNASRVSLTAVYQALQSFHPRQ